MARKRSSRKKKQQQRQQQAAPTSDDSQQESPAQEPVEQATAPEEKTPKRKSATSFVESPPTDFVGILMRLGPGLIVAGSIVGSGELIATTATGAQAGFWLLWLILIGCVIKVFVQIELGRYSIVTGQTTMAGLNQVPGPVIDISLTGQENSLRFRANWIISFWFLMFLASTAQLGGIVGGVGQALAISAPLTSGGHSYNKYAEAATALIVAQSELTQFRQSDDDRDSETKRLNEAIFTLERDSNIHLLALKQQELSRAKSSEHTSHLAMEVNSLESVRDTFKKMESLDEGAQQLVVEASLAVFTQGKVSAAEKELEKRPDDEHLKSKIGKLKGRLGLLQPAVAKLERKFELPLLDKLSESRKSEKPPAPWDDKYWATIVTAVTIVVLVLGRYGLIQSFATAMVALFTLITIVNLVMLQSHESWSVSAGDIMRGMSFRLPPGNTNQAIATALATFGIIGVGASELIIYPYWCMEKGYARFTGPRNSSPEWAERARGWMRVMRWDAWCSMVVYTFATIAFYLLGAAILFRTGLNPKGSEMIRYLSVMYAPVFGPIAQMLFLFGAFAVLYSTFFVANASLSRVVSDVLRVSKLAKGNDDAHRFRVKILSGLLPVLCLSFFWMDLEPVQLVLFSGFMQNSMLPLLAGAALYFRYRRSDSRVAPGKTWDFFIWISAAGMLVAGLWGVWAKVIQPLLSN